MAALLNVDIEDLHLNSFCFGFRMFEPEKTSALYMAYFFRSQCGRNLISALAQGATRYNLSKRALKAISFGLPSATEQRAIAAVLSDMDGEIAALEDKLAKARAVKQGMMQVLLTGEIRLV